VYLLACNDKPIPSFDPDGEDVYKQDLVPPHPLHRTPVESPLVIPREPKDWGAIAFCFVVLVKARSVVALLQHQAQSLAVER
jgi:hypothetical protein